MLFSYFFSIIFQPKEESWMGLSVLLSVVYHTVKNISTKRYFFLFRYFFYFMLLVAGSGFFFSTFAFYSFFSLLCFSLEKLIYFKIPCSVVFFSSSSHNSQKSLSQFSFFIIPLNFHSSFPFFYLFIIIHKISQFLIFAIFFMQLSRSFEFFSFNSIQNTVASFSLFFQFIDFHFTL